MWAVVGGQGEGTESPISHWKTSSKKPAQRRKAPGFVLEERMGDYVPAPTSTSALALAWTVPRVNPVIMCCGQGQAGSAGPHPFPVVGGRSIRHRDAKLSQLSS